MLGPVIQLAGDSCSPTTSIGQHLRQRLEPHASEWMDQWDLIRATGDDGFDRNLARRLALLEQVLGGAESAIIIGRSSGARVASLFAARRPARAVICLGYPFQHPKYPPEPERYEHLAHLRTPTLILQGVIDPYGGAEVLEKYAFSPNITVELVQACHEFRLTPPQWDEVAERILRFCAALPPAPAD